MTLRIINPGSTSTKVSLFEEDRELFRELGPDPGQCLHRRPPLAGLSME